MAAPRPHCAFPARCVFAPARFLLISQRAREGKTGRRLGKPRALACQTAVFKIWMARHGAGAGSREIPVDATSKTPWTVATMRVRACRDRFGGDMKWRRGRASTTDDKISTWPRRCWWTAWVRPQSGYGKGDTTAEERATEVRRLQRMYALHTNARRHLTPPHLTVVSSSTQTDGQAGGMGGERGHATK